MLLFTFSGTQVLAAGGLAVLTLVALIVFLRYRLRRARPSANDHRTKLAGADAFRQRPIFLKLGFVLALGASFLAINWTEFHHRVQIELGAVALEPDLELIPPRTIDPPQPPPPPPVIEPLPDEEIIESVSFESQDILAEEPVLLAPSPPVPDRPLPAPPPPPRREIEDDLPFKVVEEMPTFGAECVALSDKEARRQCSDRALLSYFSKQLSYPVLARENRIEGMVVLRFVVERDGSISGFETLRDPGGGLAEEALRVLRKLGNDYRWEPGKQRGRPVRVQFNLPIRFQLE